MTELNRRPKSSDLFRTALALMPGGVNSPVRAFKAVGGEPIYFERASGSRLFDVDGQEYIDYVASWGAIIRGHACVAISEAIYRAATNGTSFGANHEGEITLAQEILRRVPAADKVRFVNSGTEATLSAIRLARAATGRTKILKFCGNYHGAVDSLLAKAGSGVATLSLPDSAGVPPSTSAETLVARYNDLGAVGTLLAASPGEVAAVFVEPVAGNMGLVPPVRGYLEGLRALCDKHGVLLVFDEVMTGFRIAKGGAAELYDIKPDLICMGKVIGGGLPVGAYAGKRGLMDMVAPVGPMYQAGTLSGNPLAMAAGLTALQGLGAEQYADLERLGGQLEKGLSEAASVVRVAAKVQRVGSMISVFFAAETVENFEHAQRSDRALYGRMFHAMLDRGFYLPPSALESWFLTLAHTQEDIDRTLEAFVDSLREVT